MKRTKTTRVRCLGTNLSYTRRTLSSKAPLPKTVIWFQTRNTEYYLIGTVHQTKQSVEDIRSIFQRVTPDVAALELSAPLTNQQEGCRGPKQRDWHAICNHIRKGEFFPAIIELYKHQLIQNENGMPDMQEAEHLAHSVNATILYADRSPKVTLHRWFSRLSLTQKIVFLSKLPFLPLAPYRNLLHNIGHESQDSKGEEANMKTSKEKEENQERERYEVEVERYWIARQGGGCGGGRYTAFSSLLAQLVFVHERDLCFVSSLRGCGDGWMVNEEGRKKIAFGVFGLAHLPGIAAHWYSQFDEWTIKTLGDPSSWAQTDKLWYEK